MGNKGRWELLRAIYDRYCNAGRKEKKVILSEFCANTGYHRKYAIRLLSGSRPGRWKSEPRRGRGVSYSQEVVALLTEAAGYPWSVRLKALLPLWMPWIRKHFRVRKEMERQLLRMSARQMDRRLKAQKTTASADLRTDQARVFAETPHPGENGSLGRGHARVHRNSRHRNRGNRAVFGKGDPSALGAVVELLESGRIVQQAELLSDFRIVWRLRGDDIVVDEICAVEVTVWGKPTGRLTRLGSALSSRCKLTFRQALATPLSIERKGSRKAQRST